MYNNVKPFLKTGINLNETASCLEFPVVNWTEGLKANAYYFGNYAWADEYLKYCHRSDEFISRWKAAVGNWDGKIVVDIGCGPGNIAASLGGAPKLLIGVDVAATSLQIAQKYGYVPVLADATNLPFESAFADVAVLNAAIHHCEDMEAVLKEAARLVKPGGLLVTDHDPQLSAWNYRGPARLLWDARLFLYKIAKRGFHKADNQQRWALASEIHHKPGHGVTKAFFHNTLEPLGFRVNVFPHNHTSGAAVFNGVKGKPELKYLIGNLLSGRNPAHDGSALTLMCLARKL
ncbi:Ubiquinone/menaquinone biosynthesis C-methylase UbiE [Cnuella takakiae]|uniref:Ubiquinone/menaquinone biosynthesis C-methylase UbiE n=1 Tax=Cnuella takakiae TaxID=1302690 RepID=A0A1M5BT26_9BACT|nr:class I SAM-dependent methyltransferase [Cnuella takakiae]OLY93507.1 SAM-dependent methyltransferase [Cnuella takakiae]SHF45689.1 Ubiquinone/menaquinone biosynthesis C-methylase UbiE [Cnuella takakiae]